MSSDDLGVAIAATPPPGIVSRLAALEQ